MSKKGENIRKRKDGRWEGRYKAGYRDNGRPLYRSVYGKTYTEVKRKMQRVHQEPVIRTAICSSDEMIFADLLQLWLTSIEIKLKGGSKMKYAYLIKTQIIPYLGMVPLSQITTQVINTFLSDRLHRGRKNGAGGLSASYVRSIAFIISSALQFAAELDLCAPLKSKFNKPAIAKQELTVLSLSDQRSLEKMITASPSGTGIGILISLYTGLRVGEICALTWNDVDFAAKTIYVRHTISRISSDRTGQKTQLILDEPKTKSSKRIVPIPSTLFQALTGYSRSAHSEYVVSTNSTFVSPRTYEDRFHKLLARCGLEDMNYHALRHTFATRCIEAGVDIKSLSEILGHSNVSITLNTYVHSSIETKKQQLEKLAAITK